MNFHKTASFRTHPKNYTAIFNIFSLFGIICSGPAEWVRVGDLVLWQNDDDARPQQRRVIGRIHHPNYKAPSLYHDIALLRMESPVSFDAWVRPACLPTARSGQTVEKAVATGWGKVDWSKNFVSILACVSVQNIYVILFETHGLI